MLHEEAHSPVLNYPRRRRTEPLRVLDAQKAREKLCAERAQFENRLYPRAYRMTAAPEIKGWCPGALRPMPSGDGLVVRIRPPLGRLTPAQAQGIANAAMTHGNGIIDLSARANLQLRGVTEASHATLIDDLRTQHLIDPDIETESLRNLIVTPFRDSETTVLATALAAVLARMPRLPGKFGFALDTGPHPVLTGASADIRVERDGDGRLILRPDGHPFGRPIFNLAKDTVGLAEWFVASGGITNGRGRMAALIAKGIVPDGCTVAPAAMLPPPGPGLYPEGALLALAFGQMRAETLLSLAALGHEIRPTVENAVPFWCNAPAGHFRPDLRPRRPRPSGRCLHRRARVSTSPGRDAAAGTQPGTIPAGRSDPACLGLCQGLRPSCPHRSDPDGHAPRPCPDPERHSRRCPKPDGPFRQGCP